MLHDAGVLHRDIKPSNLLVGEDERVLVADLGSAKRLAEASGVTVTTGTPAYMAPEQARGEPVDARSDVYSLGAVTYELLSGKQPFDVSDPGSLLSRPVDSRPTALDGPRALARLDHVLASALATRPADRPASAAAFADALEQVAAGTKAKDVKRLRREVSPSLLITLAVLVFGVSTAATCADPLIRVERQSGELLVRLDVAFARLGDDVGRQVRRLGVARPVPAALG